MKEIRFTELIDPRGEGLLVLSGLISPEALARFQLEWDAYRAAPGERETLALHVDEGVKVEWVPVGLERVTCETCKCWLREDDESGLCNKLSMLNDLDVLTPQDWGCPKHERRECCGDGGCLI